MSENNKILLVGATAATALYLMSKSGSAQSTSRTVDQLTGIKLKNTVYKNTTGKTMDVYVTLICTIRTPGTGRFANASTFIGPTDNPTTIFSSVGFHTLVENPLSSLYCSTHFEVPPDYYYKVSTYVSSGETVNTYEWFEIY